MPRQKITQDKINELWRADFDKVRADAQYTLYAKKWIVKKDDQEIVIKKIEDLGPVLYGLMPDKSEVCFSPACVIRHQ